MSDNKTLPEFRFYYFTNRYPETVAFYKDILQWKVMRSWERGTGDKGTIFHSPNGCGLIEIEEGAEAPLIQGAVYIEVENVDEWYEIATRNNTKIIHPISDTSYGHRNFTFEDPGGLRVGLFKYNK